MNDNEIVRTEPFSLKSFKEQYKIGDIISFNTKGNTKITGMITALIESEDLNVPDSVVIGNRAFTFDDLYHFSDDDGNAIGTQHVYRKVENKPEKKKDKQKFKEMNDEEIINYINNVFKGFM